MVQKFLIWALQNKLLLICAFSTLCLFISTVALASHRENYCDYKSDANFGSKNDESGQTPEKVIDYRLPKYAVPKNYKLLLAPNMLDNTFNGSVDIAIRVLMPTKIITLHSNQLKIGSVRLRNNKNQNIPIIGTSLSNDKREFLHIQLMHNILEEDYELHIEFSGRLDKKIVGFYKSIFKKNRTMVASKFQPTYARQAFPCFDEPEYKATFNISLVKPSSYVALSNMNAVSKIKDKTTDLETVQFETSVAMSTYLACFVVCDFGFKETVINSNGIGNNFTLRSFAQKDELHKIDFALDIGKRATEFYIKYYQVAFPLPKLDMIAIPDYVSGATEHWGLITYRETSFLVDEATASAKNKISVANTIAHELAHMWFGNLVTMKWWDEVWLNEGFASYMQVKSLNAIEPSWTMLDQFLTKTLHSALVIDAKLSSHPIVQTVATPDQITAIFDSISYNKGSSILRMLEGFIGEENFRHGVSDYLKKFSFGNTVTQDLLGSLEPYFKKDNPDLNLTYIMDTWTKQMGYPVLTMKLSDEPNTYVISQSRFLSDPDAVYENDSPFGYRWFVPITYKTAKGQGEGILWFPNTVSSVKLVIKESDNWFKINNNQVGYYRVNYPLDIWEKLIKLLKENPKQLTISDRSHLLDDVFALAEARFVPYDSMLNLSTYLVVEEDYVPWETASAIFSNLASKLLNSLAYDSFQKYVQRLVTPLYEKQSWEKRDIPVIDNLLRTRILTLAVRSQLPHAEAKVNELFFNWLNSQDAPNATHIETDLRDFVYYYGMKSASQSDWERLWQIYLKEEDVQEKSKLRDALSAPRDTIILRRYLMLAWDEANIRSQDYLTVVQQISHNPSGATLVWDDVRTRWPQLVDRFTLNSRYLGGLIPAITSSFDTELKLKEMELFFAQYPDAGAGESARRRALETVRNNIQWTKTHLKTVSDWLTKA